MKDTEVRKKIVENGVSDKSIQTLKEENKIDAAPKPIELKLTDKQIEVLNQVVKEKIDLTLLLEEVNKRETVISSLIMDAHGIKDIEILSAELNEARTILTVVKKE